jgi:hypothetical protein
MHASLKLFLSSQVIKYMSFWSLFNFKSLGTIEDIELVKLSLRVEYELHSNKKWASFSTFKQPEHTYQKFKFNFRREIYLNEVENKSHRRYLAKFRISARNLEIEMGRYENKPRDERLCSGCLKVENEAHFLFECNSYSTLRDNFTNSI